MRFAAFISLLLLPVSAFALEKTYQKAWCDSVGGKMEVVLPDRARVDCVTDEYAVEVQPARTWAEAVGQSLYYAFVLHKRPGVVLIVGPGDNVFVHRFRAVARKHRIKLWEVQE